MTNTLHRPDVRPTGFVYVDTETTGLDYRRHAAYELAWAVDDGPIQTLLLPHRLRYAEPAALEIGGYHSRNIRGRLAAQNPADGTRSYGPTLADFVASFNDPDGKPRTFTGANPNFDVSMIWNKLIGREPRSSRARRALRLPAPAAPRVPWHHRLLDIEAYTAGAFGWDKPRGLRETRDWLTVRGYIIPAPDHTAAADVATLRAVHYACWDHLSLPFITPDLAPRQQR